MTSSPIKTAVLGFKTALGRTALQVSSTILGQENIQIFLKTESVEQSNTKGMGISS